MFPRRKLCDTDVRILLNAEEYFTILEGDIHTFFSTRFASAVWAGSTNAPALFLQSRFTASIATAFSLRVSYILARA